MTTPNDTLVLDTTLIAQWRNEGVDFNREFAVENRPKKETHHRETHSSVPSSKDNWLDYLFPKTQSGRIFSAIVLCVIFVVALLFILRKKFEAPVQRSILEADDEDTIYGVDFAASLRKAEEERNYRQCVRLRYLQLLRLLHDQRKIFWQPGKTTTQYVNEVNHPAFASLSNTFVRVRYGQYPADESLYATFSVSAAEVEQQVVASNERKETES